MERHFAALAFSTGGLMSAINLLKMTAGSVERLSAEGFSELKLKQLENLLIELNNTVSFGSPYGPKDPRGAA